MDNMEFNWINLLNGIVVGLLLIPNIIFAIKHKNQMYAPSNKILNIMEQIGRYACIILMVLPLFVREFGFSPLEWMFVYVLGDTALLILYYVFWLRYRKKQTMGNALALAVIPTLIFIVSAVSVRHWVLLIMAVLFGVSHIYNTYINHAK